jgi:hypothetical protein
MFLILSLVLLAGPADDGTSFSFPEGNFKLRYPDGWRKLNPPNENIQFAIQNKLRVIMVASGETRSTVEDVLEDYETGIRIQADALKELDRQETTVAGERAVTVTWEMRRAGGKTIMVATVFVHQGIAYQVIGARATGEDQAFNTDYKSVMESFTFLKERKEWLAKFEGKPARTALLGDLVSFELNRPRWTETTFDSRPSYNFLDQAGYQFFPGGAWITVRVRNAKGGETEELEELRHDLASTVRNAQVTNATVPSGRRRLPAVEIRGRDGEITHVIRGAVAVEDGLAVELWIQSHDSVAETVRRDWNQLLESFVLQRASHPDTPPAFPWQGDSWNPAPNPALAVFLAQATRPLPAATPGTVLAIAPDGSRALTRSRQGLALENLTTHKRTPLALEGYTNGAVAWSRDGKRLAYAAGEQVVVLTLDNKQTQKVKARVQAIAFDPGDDSLLVCIDETSAGSSFRGGGGRFGLPSLLVNRCERLPLGKGSRQVLVDFPLGRVSHPTLSPDGTRIALVTNRDYPRTAPVGRHLYVCAADGSGLRQLTRDPEDIIAVAWSPDGKWLYAARRLAVGDNGAVGTGGSADVYRLSPETGQTENLTRSGHIGRVWAVGSDLLLEVGAWDVPLAQRGLFRINVDQLARATAARPVPPPADPRAQRKALAARMQAVLGPANIKQVVPTVALLEKAARAFAEEVAKGHGRELDFSTASLDHLNHVLTEMDPGAVSDPAILFGFAAYYGQTLRRVNGAEWDLQPVPLGEWTPGQEVLSTPLAEVVLPWSSAFLTARGSEFMRLHTADELRDRQQGRKLILVYPPAHAEAALRRATGPAYYEARKLLDAGDVKPAIDILAKELRQRPRNRPLAVEVLGICAAAHLPDLADELTRTAVDAGSEVPELLLRYGDLLAPKDAAKALTYYRRAVQGPWPPAEAFLKLGKQYQGLGNTAVAESCWRRAYWRATDEERRQIRQWMGLPEVAENAAADVVDD